jgi:hypothetical protein
MTDPGVRIIPCPECGGDGGWAVPIDVDRRDGSLIERWDRCYAREATGEVEIEVEPIEMEDLESVPCPNHPG